MGVRCVGDARKCSPCGATGGATGSSPNLTTPNALAGAVLRYRVHDTTGDNLGLVEHPAPNLRPGDVVQLPDGREALVVAKVETGEAPIAALLESCPATQ